MRAIRSFFRRSAAWHTTAVAYLALILASSSAVYAAATIGSADVIDNSLQAIDLKDGAAVKGAEVVNDALSGLDIQENTLNGVGRKLQYSAPLVLDNSPPKTNILTLAGYTFKGSCGTHAPDMLLRLFINGPAGDFQRFVWMSAIDNPELVAADPGGAFISASTDTLVLGVRVVNGSGYTRASGDIWIHSGATILQATLHAIADARGSGNCLVYGNVTRLV